MQARAETGAVAHASFIRSPAYVHAALRTWDRHRDVTESWLYGEKIHLLGLRQAGRHASLAAWSSFFPSFSSFSSTAEVQPGAVRVDPKLIAITQFFKKQ